MDSASPHPGPVDKELIARLAIYHALRVDGVIRMSSGIAERIGIKVIEHQTGADPSAVLFDTVQYALAHKTDVVLADTAGRFHTKANLMSQLEKIRRVMKPDLIIYVDEAVAGNDAVVRAAEFDRTVGADAIVLARRRFEVTAVDCSPIAIERARLRAERLAMQTEVRNRAERVQIQVEARNRVER